MIDEEIKKLIKKVENLLKSDDRFMKNGDYLYKKQMKKINKEMKHGITNIPILQPPINMMLPKVVTKEVIREVPKEVIRLVPYCPNENKEDMELVPQPRRSISTDMGRDIATARDSKPDDMLDDINNIIDQFKLDDLNRRITETNQELERLLREFR